MLDDLLLMGTSILMFIYIITSTITSVVTVYMLLVIYSFYVNKI